MTIKSNVLAFLRIPFLWVMLLWPLTLPGQEKLVYQFLIQAIAGEAGTGASRKSLDELRHVQKQNVHVFVDAEVSTAQTLPQQPARFLLPAFTFSLFAASNQLAYFKSFVWFLWIHLFLPVSILPNAP
ncbi:hypothetical protein ACMA1I_17780 [Pontibacter sp. 13R65]|uniref:hypothetical protein n=1 Tax=Pontibacter sp. 13R65 TaxID=3127458 RepID=UPI00301E4E01